jgi:type IV pilus assembly protein PilV
MKSSVPGCSALNARKRATAASQSGVGLIEVMVAVLVLSIGFLGIAALQMLSLSTNNSAMARSMATISSYSILDAMRADAAVAEAGTYNTGATPVAANSCPASGASFKSQQIFAWCAQLGQTLGAQATTIGTIDCGSIGVCTVTITFDDSRAGSGGSNSQTVTARAML